MIDNKAQMSAEMLFFIGVLVIVVMLSVVYIAEQHELNIAMAAARTGAIEGAHTTSSAIYSVDAYRDYSHMKTSLLEPYPVEIINVSYSELGYDKDYDKHKIQFRVYAKTSNRFDNKELVSIGDRINFNLRKSLAISFNSTSSTNKLYNPVFSTRYVYTTANVKWV